MISRLLTAVAIVATGSVLLGQDPALRDRAETAAPDKAWTCDTCGAVAAEWSALCGNCGAFDTVSWKQPPRVSVLSSLPATGPVVEAEISEESVEADSVEEAPDPERPTEERQAS